MDYVNKKRLPHSDGRDDEERFADDSKRLPAIVQFLTTVTKPDGKKREKSTITLCWDQGMWKCIMNDWEDMLSGFFSDRSLEGILDRFEAALEDNSVDWREKKTPRKK